MQEKINGASTDRKLQEPVSLTEDLRVAIELMIESLEACDIDGLKVQLTKRRMQSVLAALVQESGTLQRELANILCRIHRDGGHYIAEHGWGNAIAETDLKVARLNAESDAAKLAATDQESVALVRILHWQQDTMESGRWVTTREMPKHIADKLIHHFERASIVEADPPIEPAAPEAMAPLVACDQVTHSWYSPELGDYTRTAPDEEAGVTWIALGQITAPVQHPDDLAVDRFAAAMKAKMAKQRAKGYGGWDDPQQCPTERLQAMLADHMAKGDPVDVANFAMMIWDRGESTAFKNAPPTQEDFCVDEGCPHHGTKHICITSAAPKQEPWSDERAFHEGRGDYEISMHRLQPKEKWLNFHDLTPIQQAGWILKAAQRFYTTTPAALKPLTRDEFRSMWINRKTGWDFYVDVDARLFGTDHKILCTPQPVSLASVKLVFLPTDHPADKMPVAQQEAFVAGWNGALELLEKTGLGALKESLTPPAALDSNEPSQSITAPVREPFAYHDPESGDFLAASISSKPDGWDDLYLGAVTSPNVATPAAQEDWGPGPHESHGDAIVQTFTGLPMRYLRNLLADGWSTNGVSIERIEEDGTVRRGAVTAGGMVLWWNQSAPTQQPLAFHAEVAAFKAWFDSWWLGDGEQGEAIPGQSDPKFKSYIDQYTLAFGAWMAAKAAAQQKPHLDLKNAVRQ